MTVAISTERLFALPCFEGLRLLRMYGRRFPHLKVLDLLPLIAKVESDANSLDMEASVQLSTIVEADCPLDGNVFYQSCIKAILIKRQPIWAQTMRRGRKRFVNSLNPDDQDVFAAAGLLDELPPSDVVNWWDEVSGFARVVSDQVKIDQGRAAEMLTIEYEGLRLNKIGITREPEWPGLDDNFAGYDVLSYDHGPTGIVNRLIEVKSTIVSPLRFYITRNEWRKAEKSLKSYIFHIWDMSKKPPVLHVRTVADISPHIPTDNGKGSWNIAVIPVAVP